MKSFKEFTEGTELTKALKPLMKKHNVLYNHYAKAVKQYDRDEMERWHKEMMRLHDEINALKAKHNMKEEKDSRLEKAGVDGYNKPKATPSHPTKSHIVVAKDGDKVKTIRFGEQGAKTAGDPKKGESEKMKKKRSSFKARHGKNIAKGKMSAAYWADKVKW